MFLTGKSFFQRTHYEILSVEEHASYDEIRASYKAAILNSHPDKLHKKSDASTDHQRDFLDVQKAWEVLSDSMSRANYDKELQSMKLNWEICLWSLLVILRSFSMNVDVVTTFPSHGRRSKRWALYWIKRV
ncbi:CSL zinc finger [Musa troglodytarum]|uniref:CSL zinc finger n=1 Tax=Musa troglodytarum TaxID=320322 RepID=A0A9E7GTG1_9LILI|nr:CSL zinc finger [Musa troglodytarum]